MHKIIIENTIIDLDEVAYLSLDELVGGGAMIKVIFKNIPTVFNVRCYEQNIVEKFKKKFLKNN